MMKWFMRKSHSNRMNPERGQSLVEIALFLPIFILIISGIVELGYYFNRYLNLLDASREAARFGADLDPIGTGTAIGNPSYNPAYNHNSPGFTGAVPDCNDSGLNDFYAVLACYAEQNMPESFDPSNGYDDIVVSAFTVNNGIVCYGSYRWPDYLDSVTYGGLADAGWSYFGNQNSLFPISRVDGMIPDDPLPQGLLIVEMFYRHEQALGLPFFTIFVPREIGVHVYSTMPNPTAGSQDCP
jgi:hypothetical protein